MALVTKSFSDIITFTRASTGTYFDSNGVLQTAGNNVPRLDYNPSTLAAQGLLIEEQRTNLRTYSDEITVANAYGTVNTTISTVSTATPISGVTTATLSVLNVGASTGNASDGLTFGGIVVSNTTQYTQSIFVKPADATVLRLRNNALGGTADFILTGNGTAPGLVSGIQAATIAPVGNGWYRCTWTFTTGTTAPGNRTDYWSLKSDVADGVNGLYFTGAQFEAGAFPTSYIPTTTTALTRSADQASVNTLSPWYNQSAMTFYAEYAPIYTASATVPSNTPHVLQVYNTAVSTNNYGIRGVEPSLSQIFVARNPTIGSQFPAVALGSYGQAGVVRKLGYAINSSDLQPAVNGALGTMLSNNVAALMAAHDKMDIGSGTGGSPPYQLNGWLRRITYYPRRLSNAELQAITA